MVLIFIYVHLFVSYVTTLEISSNDLNFDNTYELNEPEVHTFDFGNFINLIKDRRQINIKSRENSTGIINQTQKAAGKETIDSFQDYDSQDDFPDERYSIEYRSFNYEYSHEWDDTPLSYEDNNGVSSLTTNTKEQLNAETNKSDKIHKITFKSILNKFNDLFLNDPQMNESDLKVIIQMIVGVDLNENKVLTKQDVQEILDKFYNFNVKDINNIFKSLQNLNSKMERDHLNQTLLKIFDNYEEIITSLQYSVNVGKDQKSNNADKTENQNIKTNEAEINKTNDLLEDEKIKNSNNNNDVKENHLDLSVNEARNEDLINSLDLEMEHKTLIKDILNSSNDTLITLIANLVMNEKEKNLRVKNQNSEIGSGIINNNINISSTRNDSGISSNETLISLIENVSAPNLKRFLKSPELKRYSFAELSKKVKSLNETTANLILKEINEMVFPAQLTGAKFAFKRIIDNINNFLLIKLNVDFNKVT